MQNRNLEKPRADSFTSGGHLIRNAARICSRLAHHKPRIAFRLQHLVQLTGIRDLNVIRMPDLLIDVDDEAAAHHARNQI